MKSGTGTIPNPISFALGVVLTSPVIFLEVHRLIKHLPGGLSQATHGGAPLQMFVPGLLGMFLSFLAELLALRWLSKWLEKGRWGYFGYYLVAASAMVFLLGAMGY